ncbi:MAG TPA: hypothetical protein VEQ58_05250, partial [Polyangiaceae bacterium]|nr:hypothetical protein [Polyangiaceae bacterium]
GNPAPLAVAIARAIVERPEARGIESGAAWSAIGEATRDLYQQLVRELDLEHEEELESDVAPHEEIV